jgi:hypothetical protein
MTKSDKQLKYFEYLIHKLKVFLEIIMGYIQGRFHRQTSPTLAQAQDISYTRRI